MGDTKDNTVFQEVQAALLNSDCDPVEAGVQGLCALHSFVATELEGSPLAVALTEALTKMSEQNRLSVYGYRNKELRKKVLSTLDKSRK